MIKTDLIFIESFEIITSNANVKTDCNAITIFNVSTAGEIMSVNGLDVAPGFAYVSNGHQYETNKSIYNLTFNVPTGSAVIVRKFYNWQ
jgi:hypothetical protein